MAFGSTELAPKTESPPERACDRRAVRRRLERQADAELHVARQLARVEVAEVLVRLHRRPVLERREAVVVGLEVLEVLAVATDDRLGVVEGIDLVGVQLV